MPKLREQIAQLAEDRERARKQAAWQREMDELFGGITDDLAELSRIVDNRRVFGEN